jgi:hypothetical protein
MCNFKKIILAQEDKPNNNNFEDDFIKDVYKQIDPNLNDTTEEMKEYKSVDRDDELFHQLLFINRNYLKDMPYTLSIYDYPLDKLYYILINEYIPYWANSVKTIIIKRMLRSDEYRNKYFSRQSMANINVYFMGLKFDEELIQMLLNDYKDIGVFFFNKGMLYKIADTPYFDQFLANSLATGSSKCLNIFTDDILNAQRIKMIIDHAPQFDEGSFGQFINYVLTTKHKDYMIRTLLNYREFWKYIAPYVSPNPDNPGHLIYEQIIIEYLKEYLRLNGLDQDMLTTEGVFREATKKLFDSSYKPFISEEFKKQIFELGFGKVLVQYGFLSKNAPYYQDCVKNYWELQGHLNKNSYLTAIDGEQFYETYQSIFEQWAKEENIKTMIGCLNEFIKLKNGGYIPSASKIVNINNIGEKYEFIAENILPIVRQTAIKTIENGSISINDLRYIIDINLINLTKELKQKAIIIFIKDSTDLFNSEVFNYISQRFFAQWLTHRYFNLHGDWHDELMIFNSESVKQPALGSFLKKVNDYPIKQIILLIDNRYTAINNKKIIPGQSKKNHGFYPDTPDGVLEFIASLQMSEEYNDNPYVKMMLKEKTDVDKIKNFLTKLKIPKEKNIPSLSINLMGFTFKILEKDDPLGSVLGNITVCCQRMGYAGENCMIDGYNNPNSGFLVISDKDKVIAQSWIRLSKDRKRLWLDSIETIYEYNEREINANKTTIDSNLYDYFKNPNRKSVHETIIKVKEREETRNIQNLKKAYLQWAQWIKDQLGVQEVLCGGGKLIFDNVYEKEIDLNDEFGDLDIYSDILESVTEDDLDDRFYNSRLANFNFGRVKKQGVKHV